METAGTDVSATGSRRAIATASLGTYIQGYDSLLYGFFASVFAQEFFPKSDPTVALLNTFAIFAVGFTARPLGGMVFGHIGDRLGRRVALSGSILLMAAATLALALLPTYDTVGAWAPALLLGCRLLQGFSVGGEYVGANVFILEHASRGWSGRSVSSNQIAGYLGISSAAATSLVLARVLSEADLAAWGWRLPFLAAVPLGLLGLYLRLRIPDSPEFQAAANRRVAFPLGAALRTQWRGILIYGSWFAMVGLGGYLLHSYLATHLIRQVGLSPADAFAANLVAVLTLAAGALTGGYLADRYPPRTVALGAATGIALLVVPGFLIIQRGTVLSAIIGQVPVAFCLGAAATLGASLSVVLFPVEVRYTAVAFAHNVTVTVFGTTAPYVSTWLISRSGTPVAPAWYLSLMAVVGLTVAAITLRGVTGVSRGRGTTIDVRDAERAAAAPPRQR